MPVPILIVHAFECDAWVNSVVGLLLTRCPGKTACFSKRAERDSQERALQRAYELDARN